jgi:hypothetical protein
MSELTHENIAQLLNAHFYYYLQRTSTLRAGAFGVNVRSEDNTQSPYFAQWKRNAKELKNR